TCGAVNIKGRRTLEPQWRCVNGHVFDEPRVETVPVTSYEATYGATYRDAPPGIAVSRLKSAALRPNDQLAIEEVDPKPLERLFAATDEGFAELFAAAAQAASLSEDESDGDESPSAFTPPVGDTRDLVLRSIRARRGQRKFRNQLRK